MARATIKNYVPRELIFIIDSFIALIAIQVSLTLINTIQVSNLSFSGFSFELLLFWSLQLVSFILFKSYTGIVRYTGIKDAFRQIQTTSFTVFIILILNQLSSYLLDKKIIHDGGAIIYGFIAFSLLYSFRIQVKRIYQVINMNKSPIYTYVLGTELTDVSIAESLLSDPQKKFTVIGFVTESNSLKRNKIFTLPVRTIDQLSKMDCGNKALIVSESRLRKITANNKKLINRL